MTSHSNHEPDFREFDDKDEKSNDSPIDDEENALPSEQEKDAEAAFSHEESDSPPFIDSDPGPVPNGGLWAWLQVLGGFMLFFNTFGVLK